MSPLLSRRTDAKFFVAIVLWFTFIATSPESTTTASASQKDDQQRGDK